MITILSSSIGDIDRKAITVTFDIDAQFTCDVTSQILVTVNGVTVVPDAVVLSNPKRMGILLPNNIMIGDVVEWLYYSGACRIESVGTNTELSPHATPNVVSNHIMSDLILYPATDADSFVTVPQADLYISMLTMNSLEWMALSIQDREILLRIAYRDIIDHTDPTTYPNPLPICVSEAQALMASHDNVNSISSGVAATSVTGAIKQNKVGSISVSYYDTKDTISIKSVVRVPESVKSCLSDLGYVFAANSDKFKQQRLARM